MARKLDGKVAIVTGASSGIGEATAIAFATEGARVAITARREDRLAGVAEAIRNAGAEVLTVVADVQNEADCNRIVSETHAKWGKLDILVNNAGVMLLGLIGGADTEDWRRMVNTNILGLLYCTHAALPIMKTQSSGHIVNVSSVAGRTARAGAGVYNATKWGVGALSEALRQEVYKHNIRVTIIEPGAVATELTFHITDQTAKRDVQQWIAGITPLESEDIAESIVYAVTAPPRVNVNEILIRPTQQPT
jgi:NADP-dependent 3-hydroxy acid dehydrogenase YdfG